MIYFLLRLPDSLFFRWFPGSRRDCSGSGATGPLHPASQLMNKVQVAAVSNKKLLLTKILANTKLYVFFPSKSTDIQSLKTNISENWMVGRWYETFGAAFPETFQGFVGIRVYINAWIICLPQTMECRRKIWHNPSRSTLPMRRPHGNGWEMIVYCPYHPWDERYMYTYMYHKNKPFM